MTHPFISPLADMRALEGAPGLLLARLLASASLAVPPSASVRSCFVSTDNSFGVKVIGAREWERYGYGGGGRGGWGRRWPNGGWLVMKWNWNKRTKKRNFRRDCCI